MHLVDFGLCTTKNMQDTRIHGSPFWISPEMIRGDEMNELMDLYSVGYVCLELANRKHLSTSGFEAMFKSGIGMCPGLLDESRWSDEFKDFISKTACSDPKNRLSASELLQHKWLETTDTRRGMRDLFQQIFVNRSLENLVK